MSSKRYTIRLTAELEELIDARRDELRMDLRSRVQCVDGVTDAFVIRDLIARGVQRVTGRGLSVEEGRPLEALTPVTGATSRRVVVAIPDVFGWHVEWCERESGLSTHATLRALMYAGFGS
jgi:hypothetical protein